MESVPNPYQSPAASLTEHLKPEDVEGQFRPSYKLYSVKSIALATFLGSPVAGGLIMAINFKRLGRFTAAIHAVVWTAVFTAMILMSDFFLPDEVQVPNIAYVVVQVIAMYYLAKSLQGPAVETHQGRSGSLASAWAAAGIGIAVGAIVVGVIVGVVILLPE